jgi:hypothetical protein
MAAAVAPSAGAVVADLTLEPVARVVRDAHAALAVLAFKGALAPVLVRFDWFASDRITVGFRAQGWNAADGRSGPELVVDLAALAAPAAVVADVAHQAIHQALVLPPEKFTVLTGEIGGRIRSSLPAAAAARGVSDAWRIVA